jgi:hypothetical protein
MPVTGTMKFFKRPQGTYLSMRPRSKRQESGRLTRATRSALLEDDRRGRGKQAGQIEKAS